MPELMDWAMTASLVGVLAPLVGIPLAIIGLYLRAIRDHQTSKHAELLHRIERVEQSIGEFRKTVSGIERDYATKEEWLRESMSARNQLARMTEMVSKLQAGMEHTESLTTTLLSVVRAE